MGRGEAISVSTSEIHTHIWDFLSIGGELVCCVRACCSKRIQEMRMREATESNSVHLRYSCTVLFPDIPIETFWKGDNLSAFACCSVNVLLRYFQVGSLVIADCEPARRHLCNVATWCCNDKRCRTHWHIAKRNSFRFAAVARCRRA